MAMLDTDMVIIWVTLDMDMVIIWATTARGPPRLNQLLRLMLRLPQRLTHGCTITDLATLPVLMDMVTMAIIWVTLVWVTVVMDMAIIWAMLDMDMVIIWA